MFGPVSNWFLDVVVCSLHCVVVTLFNQLTLIVTLTAALTWLALVDFFATDQVNKIYEPAVDICWIALRSFKGPKGFVIQSASISSDAQWKIVTSGLCSIINLLRMSKKRFNPFRCRSLFSFWSLPEHICTAAWLSQNTLLGVFCTDERSSSSSLRYKVSLTASVSAYISLSHDEVAVTFCNCDDQATGEFPYSTTLPLVDFLVCGHPAQFASLYVTSTGLIHIL